MKHRCKFASYQRILVFLSVLALALLCLPLPAHAATASGITIKAIIPENQVDTSKTYYDLRLEPGQKQTIQLSVCSGSDEPLTAFIEINTASTGRNGLIQYNAPDVQDESLLIPITDVARVVTPQVSLPPKGEVTVDIELQMPETAFDGCILGGVVVTAEAENAGEESVAQNNMQIINNFAYTVGLKISQNDNEIKPDMHLKAIKPELVNYRPMVTVNLQNSEPYIIKGMSIDAQVFEAGSSEAIKEMNMPEVDMAPNSNFNAGIDWNDKSLQPGVYRLKMRAEHEDQIWEWDEEFTIENTDANRINSDSAYIEKPRPVWMYWLIGLVVLLTVALLAFFLGKRQKEKLD